MCDLDNMWDEAAKIGTEELDDDIMSILDNIPLESVEGDRDGTLFEDQWFMTSPHCFGPIPSNVLFFEPIPDRKNGIGPTHSSPIHTTPINPSKNHAAPEEKPRGFQTQGHVSALKTSSECNNPRKNPNPISNSKESTIPVRARSKRTKPSGPTKWHISSSIVRSNQIFEKDSTTRVSSSSSSSPTKTCAHCNVTKTPQWREGPSGPKTLCNACGVRYRTGRLFPEYRPACSPTFQPCLHSNSHKKVIEMRNYKAKLDR